jgi:hypothetical protein
MVTTTRLHYIHNYASYHLPFQPSRPITVMTAIPIIIKSYVSCPVIMIYPFIVLVVDRQKQEFTLSSLILVLGLEPPCHLSLFKGLLASISLA